MSFETTRRLAEKLKSVLPNVPIVLAATTSPLCPKTRWRMTPSTSASCEGNMLELVEHYEHGGDLSQIAGICYRGGAINLHLAEAKEVQGLLDQLPFPARHLLPPNIYRPVPVDEHAFPKFSMVTSRGCPHACAFCQKSRSGYRSHSPEFIVDEIEHLVRDWRA